MNSVEKRRPSVKAPLLQYLKPTESDNFLVFLFPVSLQRFVKYKLLTLCRGRSPELFRIDFRIVLELEGPAHHLHDIEDCHDGVFLVVFLIVVIHLGRVMPIVIGSELQRLRFAREVRDASFWLTATIKSCETALP